MTPTGFGYYAGPGYDLVSGLGSPNGTVLARTLSAAAHAQMYFADVPDMVNGSLADGWTSGTAQSLLFQTMSGSGVDVGVTLAVAASITAAARRTPMRGRAGWRCSRSIRTSIPRWCALRQAGAGCGSAALRRRRQALDVSPSMAWTRRRSRRADQCLRLCRLHVERRRGARGAACRRGGDGRRRRRPAGRRARAPERPGFIVGHLLQGRRLCRHGERPAAGARRAMPLRRLRRAYQVVGGTTQRRRCRGRDTATTARRCCRTSMPAT
jgi:hypothetical protein